MLDLAQLIAQVNGPKKVAVAAAADSHVLEAVNEARADGMIVPILYGALSDIEKVAARPTF